MIISELIGGLGNQLFQYATGYAVAKRSQAAYRVDSSAFSNYQMRRYGLPEFAIPLMEATRNERTDVAFGGRLIEEASLRFDPQLTNPIENAILRGYWQTEKYFADCRADLLSQIVPRDPFSDLKVRELQKVTTENLTISVHVRRGDYISNPSANAVHGTLDLDYYARANEQLLMFIGENVARVQYIVFSDDPTWASDNLKFLGSNLMFIGGGPTSDFLEMFMMSLSHHHIIANSSFSWWGAWLCQSEKQIVMAPDQWFRDPLLDSRDIIPSRWIRT